MTSRTVPPPVYSVGSTRKSRAEAMKSARKPALQSGETLMNSLHAKSNGEVNTRQANICNYCLIFILSIYCTGCVGLTSADTKNGTTSASTPPTISISAPATGTTVSGAVSVTTSVTSNTASVLFRVDGNNAGAAVTSAPFDFSLDTTKLSDGSKSLTAVATSLAGKSTS